MQGFGGQIGARCDDTAFIIAIGADDVEGRGRAEIDDDQRALVRRMGRNRIDEAIRANGMNLYGMTEAERKTVKVPAIHLTEVQQLARQRPIDIALVSVKSYDTIWACQMIRQYLAPDGIVASMQNCVNEERVASAVGWGRTLGIIVGGGVGVDLYEPGHIRRGYAKRPNVTSFYVGEPSGMITKRSRELATIMNDVDTAKATDNLWGERWTKLCVNAMRNGVSAATGMGGNARDRHDAVRRVCIALGGESVRVGQKLGYKLGSIGALPPESLARAMEGPEPSGRAPRNT